MRKNMLCCVGALVFLAVTNVFAADYHAIIDLTNGLGDNYAQDMVMQADGKALMAGYYIETKSYQHTMFVMRYASDGALDESFGEHGVVMLAGPTDAKVNILQKVGVLSDGKILLVGQRVVDNQSQLLFSRLSDQGVLDRRFGSEGYVVTVLDSITPNIIGLRVDKDDQFFVTLANKDAIRILKFKPDGSLNTAFAHDGILRSDISGGQGTRAAALALQDDGKLVVVGTSYGDTHKQAFIARYDALGELDTSFAGKGYYVYRGSSDNADGFTDVRIQPNGQLIVSGFSIDQVSLRTQMLLMRFAANGSLDMSFGHDGVIQSCFNDGQSDCYGAQLTLKKDDQLLVASSWLDATGIFPVLYQFDARGALDLSYGVRGSKSFANISNYFSFTANQLNLDGHDVVAGYAPINGVNKLVLTSQ